MILPKNREYLFERLEAGNNLESSNVIEKMKDGMYSVEHIMPQTLTPFWRRELGEDAEEIHQTWLHRIANLTLTAYNSSYSNRSFTEKRDLPEKGFRESGIRLNQYIAGFDHWTLTELQQRQAVFNQRALQMWPFPQTSFQPEEKPADIHSLDEDFDFTGYSLKGYSFEEITARAGSWKEMFVAVVKLIYEGHSAAINRLADKPEFLSLIRTQQPGYEEMAGSIKRLCCWRSICRVRGGKRG
ncbi:MAG: HNH endonuclease family protein [Bacteroides sp.]|nr:HNH endonuclease family protein [Bacteroides sp.]